MLADTAMAGRMATADSIAAVAIGAAITQFVIGIWSLLRMGTTGFTAQAWGACDVRALLRQLTSGSIIALSVGLLLILLRPLYVAPAAALLQAGADMHLPEAQTYLHYSFLGAPAALLLYVYNGWLIGVQRMKLVMSVSIACNLLNILFSYLLAFPAGMGVGGLALGTVLAQYTAVRTPRARWPALRGASSATSPGSTSGTPRRSFATSMSGSTSSSAHSSCRR